MIITRWNFYLLHPWQNHFVIFLRNVYRIKFMKTISSYFLMQFWLGRATVCSTYLQRHLITNLGLTKMFLIQYLLIRVAVNFEKANIVFSYFSAEKDSRPHERWNWTKVFLQNQDIWLSLQHLSWCRRSWKGVQKRHFERYVFYFLCWCKIR